jgi:hypothetical protein
MSPNSLVHIPASIANFGNVPYGHNLQGRVYYDPLNEDNDMACKHITNITITPSVDHYDSPIIMVNR